MCGHWVHIMFMCLLSVTDTLQLSISYYVALANTLHGCVHNPDSVLRCHSFLMRFWCGRGPSRPKHVGWTKFVNSIRCLSENCGTFGWKTRPWWQKQSALRTVFQVWQLKISNPFGRLMTNEHRKKFNFLWVRCMKGFYANIRSASVRFGNLEETVCQQHVLPLVATGLISLGR